MKGYSVTVVQDGAAVNYLVNASSFADAESKVLDLIHGTIASVNLLDAGTVIVDENSEAAEPVELKEVAKPDKEVAKPDKKVAKKVTKKKVTKKKAATVPVEEEPEEEDLSDDDDLLGDGDEVEEMTFEEFKKPVLEWVNSTDDEDETQDRMASLKKILKKNGGTKISDVDASKYQSVLDALNG